MCLKRPLAYNGFVWANIVIVPHAQGGGMGGDHGDDDEDDEPLYQLETLPEPKLKQNIFRNKHLLNRSYVPISYCRLEFMYFSCNICFNHDICVLTMTSLWQPPISPFWISNILEGSWDIFEKDWKNMDQYQKFEDILFQRPVKFEDSEVEVGVDINSDRSILRKFIISQPFHKVGSQVDKNPLIRSA